MKVQGKITAVSTKEGKMPDTAETKITIVIVEDVLTSSADQLVARMRRPLEIELRRTEKEDDH